MKLGEFPELLGKEERLKAGWGSQARKENSVAFFPQGGGSRVGRRKWSRVCILCLFYRMHIYIIYVWPWEAQHPLYPLASPYNALGLGKGTQKLLRVRGFHEA